MNSYTDRISKFRGTYYVQEKIGKTRGGKREGGGGKMGIGSYDRNIKEDFF